MEKSENGSQICGSAILKEKFSSYEELSSREVIFIHNIPAVFFFIIIFTQSPSSIILEFSHLICLNHKNPINLPKIGNLLKIGKISPLLLKTLWENSGNQHFLLFPQCFLIYQSTHAKFCHLFYL